MPQLSSVTHIIHYDSVYPSGMFSALRYDHYGQKDVYVDGGVLCNYPIHCFDGEYVSLVEKQTEGKNKRQKSNDAP